MQEGKEEKGKLRQSSVKSETFEICRYIPARHYVMFGDFNGGETSAKSIEVARLKKRGIFPPPSISELVRRLLLGP